MRHRLATILILCLVSFVLCPSPIRAAAASTRTDEKGGSFITLFNGKDLAGWHGQETTDPRKFTALSGDEKAKQLARDAEDLKEHWRVENSEIVNDGQGVYLTTDKDYGDIELLVDFKIGPKGDSGVYLRGTPQVQVWDFTEPSYANLGADKGSGGLWNNSPGNAGKDPLTLADNPIGQWNTFRIIQTGARTTVYLNGKLDPRQYHGSAYGMVPAKVGYQRPVGLWNFQEVTVKGSKIKVELNGTVILDADLSTVKDFMANSAHAGKDRASGFFGLAGHNDPVEFRNIAIKPLH